MVSQSCLLSLQSISRLSLFIPAVNYFGIIRTVKAFLLLLKAQAREYRYDRIVNVMSMAGLVTGGFAAPYHASKFAAQALSSCL